MTPNLQCIVDLHTALGELTRVRPTFESPISGVGSVSELESADYCRFMSVVNAFAASVGLHVYPQDWSKVWEYPWVWYHCLSHLPFRSCRILDVGPANRPMPWVCAALGAKVTLLEIHGKWLTLWDEVRSRLDVDIDWQLVVDDHLPFESSSFDVVTSLSVLEHQSDQRTAVTEIGRVLRDGGTCVITADVCETSWGMAYPPYLGQGLTIDQFGDLIWSHEAFDSSTVPFRRWSRDECESFLRWHTNDASDSSSRYIVAGACMTRLPRQH